MVPFATLAKEIEKTSKPEHAEVVGNEAKARNHMVRTGAKPGTS